MPTVVRMKAKTLHSKRLASTSLCVPELRCDDCHAGFLVDTFGGQLRMNQEANCIRQCREIQAARCTEIKSKSICLLHFADKGNQSILRSKFGPSWPTAALTASDTATVAAAASQTQSVLLQPCYVSPNTNTLCSEMFFLPRLCLYILGGPRVIWHFHLMSAAFKFYFHAGCVGESVTLGLPCEDRRSVGEL